MPARRVGEVAQRGAVETPRGGLAGWLGSISYALTEPNTMSNVSLTGRSGRPHSRSAILGPGLLACLTWYAAIVLAFLILVARQSDARPAEIDCAPMACVSDRDGLALLGFFYGPPALFASCLVSVTILALLAAWTPIRSAVVLGTLAATPALALFAYVAVLAW
jgi:hypothetical protein